jgi:hypothetical protein
LNKVLVKPSGDYEQLLKYPVRTVKSHTVDFVLEGEKLILPLGSCTSVIFVGNNDQHRNIIGANHIQMGQPCIDNKHDAFDLTDAVFKGYQERFNILPHQLRPIFFIGGKTDSLAKASCVDHPKIFDPGKINIEYTNQALKKNNLIPMFNFTRIAISLHLLIKENLLFALLRNNEISKSADMDTRLFYEFIIVDLSKIYKKEFKAVLFDKPLRKQAQVFGLTDLVHAFFTNQVDSYSYYDGLFYLAKIT